MYVTTNTINGEVVMDNAKKEKKEKKKERRRSYIAL